MSRRGRMITVGPPGSGADFTSLQGAMLSIIRGRRYAVRVLPGFYPGDDLVLPPGVSIEGVPTSEDNEKESGGGNPGLR